MNLEYLWSKIFKKIRGRAIKNTILDSSVKIGSGSLVLNSSIGKYSYCGYDCKIINCNLGPFCCLADNVVIGSAEHPMNWVSMSPVFQNVKNSGPVKRFCFKDLPVSRKTHIGADVWIGQGAMIKGGVTIGTGAVIGMGSIVTKDVEPYAIVGGCPAKLIKYRFSEDIRKKLLSTNWWSLSDIKIQKIAEEIQYPEEFYKAFKNTNFLSQ